jgi:predicted RNase H-like HicB family nuclease
MSSLDEIREDLVSVIRAEVENLLDQGYDVEEILDELSDVLTLLREEYDC